MPQERQRDTGDHVSAMAGLGRPNAVPYRVRLMVIRWSSTPNALQSSRNKCSLREVFQQIPVSPKSVQRIFRPEHDAVGQLQNVT